MSVAIGSAKRALKKLVIAAGFEAVALSGARSIWPSAAGRGIIFTLHNVHPALSEPFWPNKLLWITPQFLERAIKKCKDRNLTPIHLHDIPAFLADRRGDEKFCCFTLDDGYRDNHTWAAPVFERFEVPYTIFITKGFVERTRSIWWRTAEVVIRKLDGFEFDFGSGLEPVRTDTMARKFAAFERVMASVAGGSEDSVVERLDRLAARNGVDPLDMVTQLTMGADGLRALSASPLASFGAHTVDHVNLLRVDPQRLDAEMRDSADAVERFVGRRPATFSYPYGGRGAAGDREFKAATACGFSVAVTTQPGVVNARSASNMMALPRVSLNGLYQKERYVDAMISGIPFKFM